MYGIYISIGFLRSLQYVMFNLACMYKDQWISDNIMVSTYIEKLMNKEQGLCIHSSKKDLTAPYNSFSGPLHLKQ